jgi:phosphoenolpyruvate synthase/pyruvate phosphate dikinase
MRQRVITTGRTASPGSAVGTVRTVKKEKLEPLDRYEELKDRFSEGDILLVYKMYPMLTPLGKKADAILTYADSSLTDRAAMFSRETNTPCVIGLESISDIEDGGTIVVKTGESLDIKDERTGRILAP